MMSNPTFARENSINCSRLEGRAPSLFVSNTTFLPQNFRLNSVRQTLGIYLLCNHQRGMVIVPICTETASWTSLLSQNPIIEFSHLLTTKKKRFFFFFALRSKSVHIQYYLGSKWSYLPRSVVVSWRQHSACLKAAFCLSEGCSLPF